MTAGNAEMAAPEVGPTVFSRMDRLDAMMGHLEEIARGSGRLRRSSASSGTATTGSDGGGGGGAESPPWSLDLRCRPIEEALAETRLKGPLIDRLLRLEDRVLKLGLQLGEEMEVDMETERKKEERRTHRKGLKSLVKSCMRGKTGDHHHKDQADV